MLDARNQRDTIGAQGEVMEEGIGGFGGARCPYDVARRTPEKAGGHDTRLVQRMSRTRPPAMRAGRIGREPLDGRQPRVARRRNQRRSGVVIEVQHCPKSGTESLQRTIAPALGHGNSDKPIGGQA